MIVGKDLVKLCRGLIAVHLAGLLSHLDTAEGHECSLQGLICLKTDNLLEILHGIIHVSCAVSEDIGNNLCLHIENAALCSLFLLQFLELAPELICCFCRTCEE